MPAAGIRKAASLGISVVLLFAASTAVAGADSIYLNNGNVIRTSSAAIDGDRLVFSQFGKQMAIPLAVVDRIEEDDFVEPARIPSRPAPQVLGAALSTEPEAVAGAVAAVPTEAPEQTREYWQRRVLDIESERNELDLLMLELRRVERAFLFSHRSTTNTRGQIEEVQTLIEANERALPELRREARGMGIPAGWLRL